MLEMRSIYNILSQKKSEYKIKSCINNNNELYERVVKRR